MFVRLKHSAKEFKKPVSLAGAALLIAVNAAINQFSIFLTPTLKIGFSFLAVALSGLLFGPLLTGVAGAAADIVKYLLYPNGPFFPGFTLNEFLIGVIYGLFLYKKKVTLPRVFLAVLTNMLLINFILNPLWLSMLYGKAFIVLLAERIVKNVILLPINTALLYFLAKAIQDKVPLAKRSLQEK